MALEIFSAALNNTIKNENSITENGAVGFKTSGAALVDFFFKASSYRNRDEEEIEHDFANVYDENPLLALKTIFFVGDIRGGLGERRLFKTCFNWLCKHHVEDAKKLVSLIPEYSRWDVLVELLDNAYVSSTAFGIVKEQLSRDINFADDGKSISLLAKWLPSINTSSEKTVALARRLCKQLHMNERMYRKMLSSLRKHLEVVERKMTANEWDEINYNAVPSKANLLYRKAFLKHDGDRRQQYLAALENREDGVKINSGASFPYEIVKNYMAQIYDIRKDATLEEMWKALPDYVQGRGADTICIVDGSGSMGSEVSGNVTCHDVARSLAIYFSERMAGAFNNKFITFSKNPKLVDLSKKDSLLAKIEECKRHAEYENTDIEKAFDLILKTAVNNHVSQEDMPKNILILSDMEFDDCVESTRIEATGYFGGSYGHGNYTSGMKTLFEEIEDKYHVYGYKLPRLVFWNINSRTDTIPVKENECGVALVSGFSPTIASMVFSGKTTPYDTVVEKLNSSRYDAVENALKA